MKDNTNFEHLIVEDINGEEQATISGGDGAPQQPGIPGFGTPQGGGLDPYQLFLQKQYFDFLQQLYPSIFGGDD
ncbi:hypothetical protein [Mastigocoleus testarum]|uniref:Uncharacterized protein n=1 Tax=Mastigocoleus testarum BC008 TaxID=371196 RepID=A0A0V7ZM10_9CYAN|nr:hypothetical protein [Mastigocoleus testarum]KST65454.1 hypothetical protein BC008_41720 [Mastigocoleus testarum BC008]